SEVDKLRVVHPTSGLAAKVGLAVGWKTAKPFPPDDPVGHTLGSTIRIGQQREGAEADAVFTGQVLAALQAVALEASVARQAREPVEQLVGGALGFLFQQPGHQVRQRQRLLAALDHLAGGAWRARLVALALAAGAGKLRRLRLEARQRIDVGLDLTRRAEEGALWTGEQWQRGLRHG